MKCLQLFFWFSLVAFISCQPKSPKTEPSPQSEFAETPPVLISDVEALRIRLEPGLESGELCQVDSGIVLEYAGEASSFLSTVSLRGKVTREPWLKVKACGGKTGWVYAGALRVEEGSSLERLLAYAKLSAVAGKDLSDKAKAYAIKVGEAKDEKELEAAYVVCKELIDSVNAKLELSGVEADNSGPGYEWLGKAIPGVVPEWVAEGTVLSLFVDYKQWESLAKATQGSQDDGFFSLAKGCFEGGVDFYYPIWFMQTWDYGGTSLLGSGKHLEKVEAMSKLSSATLYKKDLVGLKDLLVRDISESEYYNYSQSKCVDELGKILSGKYAILNQNDLVQLNARLKQLESGKGVVFESMGGG